MVPTDEAKITFGMLYSLDVPAAIASILLAMLPPVELWTSRHHAIRSEVRDALGIETIAQRLSSLAKKPFFAVLGR
jgi:hypothetical protein